MDLVKKFLIKYFESPIGLSRPLWRDISAWQGNWNASVSKMNGVKGVFIRATRGSEYQDVRFAENWAKAEGMYRASYHVLFPDESVGRQLDNWYSMNPEIDVIPRVIDMELERGCSPEYIAYQMWQMSCIINSRDGVRPIIYSRRLLIDDWLDNWTKEKLHIHYYWLAQYLLDRVREHPGPPTLPKRVSESRIIMHQTADKKPGFPEEVESNSVDYDRWEIGTEEQMHLWIFDTWGGDELPPPSQETKVELLWEHHPELH